MRNIVCCINSDESVAEPPECLHLEGSLDTEHKCILIQLRSWRWGIQLILIKDRNFFALKAVNP